MPGFALSALVTTVVMASLDMLRPLGQRQLDLQLLHVRQQDDLVQRRADGQQRIDLGLD